MTRTAVIAPVLRIFELGPEQVIQAWRTVRVADMDDPDLPLSFRSHYEEGIKPRFVQEQHGAMHMAVSFWRARSTALKLGRKMFPKHGEYLAEVMLTYGYGINYLDPALEHSARHLTVWSQPETLANRVVKITPLY